MEIGTVLISKNRHKGVYTDYKGYLFVKLTQRAYGTQGEKFLIYFRREGAKDWGKAGRWMYLHEIEKSYEPITETQKVLFF
jgi:hypothetical protein